MAYLPQGAILFCYTDGIVEQENESGVEFGLDVLMEMIKSNADVFTMKDMHFRVLDAYNDYRKNLNAIDDVTLLSIRCLEG
jgi:serine phosphatase RsbU (regulator of sigma subunit)